MKISKLFHWLYAFVMFLPVFAIGGSLLISTFNMSAKQENEIHYKFETNDVNNTNDLKFKNIYTLTITEDSNTNTTFCYGFAFYNMGRTYDFVCDVESYANYFRFWQSGSSHNIFLELNGSNVFTILRTEITLPYSVDVVLQNIGELDYTHYQKSDFNIINSVVTNNINTEEVFYNAVDKVTQSPLFSWSYNSFLVAPFSYIVALFGMPTNHVVVELLSYWLAISIIWLVFDLVMYVPLLVHRWLDKGVLE